jgi:phosphoribosylformylglycinamidine synthase
METDAIVAIQDMGAAGLTSSSVEMAGKGGMGIELDLDAVPQRESGMTAYEMMLSESQERMLMVLHPGREAEAERIFRKWELDFRGDRPPHRHRPHRHPPPRRVEADIPLAPLESEAPPLPPPHRRNAQAAGARPRRRPRPSRHRAALLTLVASPDLCSRRWIWDQYDSMVGGQTASRPGAADAAVVRIEDHSRALALTTDVTRATAQADPETAAPRPWPRPGATSPPSAPARSRSRTT